MTTNRTIITIEIAGDLSEGCERALVDNALKTNGRVIFNDLIKAIPNGEERFDGMIMSEISTIRDVKNTGSSIAIGGFETTIKLHI